jgi:membrane-associated phospholipid phosphatase
MMSTDTMRALRSRNAGHRSVALWVVLGYLLATLIPAFNAARAGREHGAIILAAHLAGCVAVAVIATFDTSSQHQRTFDGALRDWTPLLAVPALYAEVPDLIYGANARFQDQLVQGWEAALFGASPAHTAAARLPWMGLSELLHLGYLSYYGIIYLPPLWLYLRNERREFEVTITALAITFTGCFAVFAFFPVAGPRYLWTAPPGIPDGPVRRLALTVLEAGSSKGAAFPSSHVAVSMVQSVMMLRHHRKAGLVISAASLLLALGAVYGGFHYGVDVLAGAATGGLIAATTILGARARGLAADRLAAGAAQPLPSTDQLS